MCKRLLSKPSWEAAIGAAKKAKRLKLLPNEEDLFVCPVSSCDSEPYHSQRGLP